MNMLENLLGGQQQGDYQNFANRYDQGAPEEGYSGQEVMDRYSQIAPNLPFNNYTQAAEQAFERMSPQQRQEFGQFLQQQAQQHNIDIPQFSQGTSSSQFQNSGFLAQALGSLHQQQPGLVGQLLGGVMGGGSGNIGSSGGGASGILGNPAAKAALAGIAAMAVKQFMGHRQ